MTKPSLTKEEIKISKDSQNTYEIRMGTFIKGGIFIEDLSKFVNDLFIQERQEERERLAEKVLANYYSICSRHQKYDKDCELCNSLPIKVSKVLEILQEDKDK